MRHQVAGRKLGRNTHERRSLFRNLIRSLILKEQIRTTLAKAKAIKGQIDKLMTLAKSGSLTARRRALAVLTDKGAVEKLFKEIAARAKNRTSGFTRIRRLDQRLGDNSQMAQIEFVDPPRVDAGKKVEVTKK